MTDRTTDNKAALDGSLCPIPKLLKDLESVPASPWLPWVVAPLLAAGFWVTEAAVHTVFFGEHDFWHGVFSPDPHELWMRLVVLLMLMGVAALWSLGMMRHRSYLKEARAYQERLAAATSRYAYGESEERRELADKLHENVGQTLAAARLFLASIDAARQDPMERDSLRSVERILDRAIADCRDIATELSPPVLDEYGLEPALETLARRLMRQTGTSIEIEGTEQDAPLSRETLLAAFGVLAEVVEGAASHPATSSVRITATRDADQIAVIVNWDGPCTNDFFIEAERMNGVGGSVTRRSGTLGTEVVICAPVRPAA